jgi:hypothetical protein
MNDIISGWEFKDKYAIKVCLYNIIILKAKTVIYDGVNWQMYHFCQVQG